MSSNEGLGFDTVVTRVTPTKPAELMKLRELWVDDEFTHEGKHLKLRLERGDVLHAVEGRRALRYGKWYMVMIHGQFHVLKPLVDSNDPFSEPKDGRNVIPEHGEEIEILVFQAVVPPPTTSTPA